MAETNELEETKRALAQAQRRIDELSRERARYHSLFEHAPISLWEEDYSEVKRFVDELRGRGVHDLRRHFEENQGDLIRATQLVKILDVNRTTASLYGASTKAEMFAGLDRVFVPESLDAFRETLLAFAEGRYAYECETVNAKLDGTRLLILLSALMPAGHEETWDRVFIGALDITERAGAMEARRRAEMQEEIIRAQQATLSALATPVIPITDDTLVTPLVGTLDASRMEQLMSVLLSEVERRQASTAIVDITGVPRVDAIVADMLLRAAQAVRLLGARVILTGIRPEVAQVLVGLDVDLRSIVTHATLQAGIAQATRKKR